MSTPLPDGFPELRPVRVQGKAYFAALRAILQEEGDAIYNKAKALKDTGRLTVKDVCRLALEHRLNLKATFEFLEDKRIVRTGTYERVKDGGIRPMTALRETWLGMQAENEQ